MPRFFDITAPTYTLSLDTERKGQVPFTVTNASGASIRGEAVVDVESGTDRGWFSIERPSRHFAAGATEQLAVAIAVPPETPAGNYRFRLRMLLGGGIPEEQYDDSQPVQFSVEPPPEEPPPPPPPPKRTIPWWVIALGVLAVVVVIGIVAFLLWPRPPVSTATVINFESPSLGGANALITNPLVTSGVVFTTNPPGVVGLVRNRATSACVDPASDDQNLATGVGTDAGSVGRAAFPLQAQFSPPLAAGSTPARVSAVFQTGVGATVRLRLIGTGNQIVAESSGTITTPQGTCGFPGDQRGSITLSVESSQPVTTAILEGPGGRVFVVDDFTFQPGQ